MKDNKMINNNDNSSKTIITFSNNELDIIYDALTELQNMIDNEEEQEIINDIFTKMYNAQFNNN
jgi:hypothetical protein